MQDSVRSIRVIDVDRIKRRTGKPPTCDVKLTHISREFGTVSSLLSLAYQILSTLYKLYEKSDCQNRCGKNQLKRIFTHSVCWSYGIMLYRRPYIIAIVLRIGLRAVN